MYIHTGRRLLDRELVVVVAAPARVLIGTMGLQGSDHPVIRVLVQVWDVDRSLLIPGEVNRVDSTALMWEGRWRKVLITDGS